MNIEYDMWKAENPDQDFSQEEYRMAAVNMNAFEYNSIEDQQLNKEFWVNIGALVMMVGATVVAVVVPPVGVPLALTIGTTYGALELGTAVIGKDWISGRELGTGERWMRGLLSPLDIVPVAGMKKFATGARLGNQVVNLGEMAVKPGLKSTIKREVVHVGDMINTGGKMTVQRVKSAGAAIKDAANVAKSKLAKDIQDLGRVADSAITLAKNITSTRKVVLAEDVGKIHIPAENTHFFENKAKQLYSKAESVTVGGTKGTGKFDKEFGGIRKLENIEEFVKGNKEFEDVLEDYANLYAKKINSNEPWSWGEDILGAENLSLKQKRLIKEQATSSGHIPQIPVNKVEGMRYGFADFAGGGLVEEIVYLPEEFWKLSDKRQFTWLDKQIGGPREGMTWHHTEIPGKMELVPYGIHNITPHNGGRTTGMWADAPR